MQPPQTDPVAFLILASRPLEARLPEACQPNTQIRAFGFYQSVIAGGLKVTLVDPPQWQVQDLCNGLLLQV